MGNSIVIVLIFGVIIIILGFLIKLIAVPKKVEHIKKYLKQGKITNAIKLAKKIISKNPNDYNAHYYLGKAYLEDNRTELALIEFQLVNDKCLFEDISEKEFRKTLGQLYIKKGKNDLALKQYILLCKLDPQNPDVLYSTGKLFDDKGKTDLAYSYYNKVIQLNPKHVKAHAAVAFILFKGKQLSDARKEIDKAISLEPDNPTSYYCLGKILKETKDYASAVNAFEKALRDPELKQKSYIERGACYYAAHNIEKAIYELEKAIKVSTANDCPETLFAQYFLASCYESTRNIENAVILWRKINSVSPNYKDVSAKLAQYKDLSTNDYMKEFLTSGNDSFVDFCKQICFKVWKLTSKSEESSKSGCKLTVAEGKAEDWVRQQLQWIYFYRDGQPVEASTVKRIHEEMKSNNIVNCIYCTTGSFTQAAKDFAETRPIKLIDNEALTDLLSSLE